MAKNLKINNPKELRAVNDLIHDCYFDVDDIEFEASTSVLSFRFRRVVTQGKNWWKDFISNSKMSPAIECFLKIHHVESYSIKDTQKIGAYDFNVLVYDSSTSCIGVRTGVPIDIKMFVRDFEISVEVTDNLFEQSKGHAQRTP
jgi:hypothetical protein